MKPTITTTLISVFFIIFTAYVAYRFATRRDRRKEHNIIAEKNILALEEERQFIINHKAIYGRQQIISFSRFISNLSMLKRIRFNIRLKEYNKSKDNSKFTKPDPHNHSYLCDKSITVILESIDELIKSIKFK